MFNYFYNRRDLELKNNPIFKSLWILVSGTGIAQLFPIISAPIVARLYDPQHFGTYALFTSLVTLLTGLSFLEYNNILIVADSDAKAKDGIILSILVTFSINLLVFLFIVLLPQTLLALFFGKDILPFLWVIPITVFFNTLNLLFYTWFLRKENYRLLSKNKIILSLFGVVFQIGIGLLYIGTSGFIIANLLSILFSLILLIYNFRVTELFLLKSFNWNSIQSLAFEYRRFSLVSVWGNVINIITLQMPQFILNKFFGSSVLGQYSLAQNMISYPLGFVSNSIQDVFKQSASKEEIENKNCKKAYIGTLKITSFFATILLIACLTFIPSLFVFVFGSKWADSGIYVKVLASLFVIRFVVAPLSYTFYIKLKQHLDFMWQLGLFILSMFTLFGGYYWFEIRTPINLLTFYSVCLSGWYFLNLWITYNLSKK